MIQRTLSTIAVVLFTLSSLGLSSTARAQVNCHEDVCIQFSDIAGYYLLTVTDVSDGQPLEVTMTDVPSHLSPTYIPPIGDGGTPPNEPLSMPGTESNRSGGHDIQDGPHVPPPSTYTYTFRGSNGVWVVTITVIFGPDGEVVDVVSNVTFIPGNEVQ